MEFGVLGPFRMWRQGQPWEVSAARHRTLLATLVLHANEVVSVDRLIEIVWGAELPSRPKAALQTYVTRLRRVLAEAGSAASIRRQQPGYRLDVRPDQVDLTRFTALVQAADLAAERADVDSETRHLRDALALWRGEPLAGIESDTLHREILPRLAEQHLRVLRRRIELELRQGRHTELVPELVALTERYPLHEQLAQLLMLALYRCGRRAEALETYRCLTLRLTDELGIDPAGELQDLHRAVLNDTVPGPDEPAPTREPVHRQPEPAGWLGQCRLPPDVVDLVGRDHAVAELTEQLRPNGTVVPIVTVSGGPGVGKTALAVRVAHRLRADYPDGQWYVRLDGASTSARSAGQVLHELLRTAGVDSADIPDDAAERAGLLRGRLTDRRVLLLLEDAADAGQVQPLLPGTPGNAVLLTSRSALGGLTVLAGARRHVLPLLDHRDATRLLVRLVGRARADHEPAAVDELARLCGGLPLALRIAAANLAERSAAGIGEYVTELRGSGPLALSAPGDPQVAVRAAFDLSYASLPAERQRAFRLLGLALGTDVSREAAALWAMPVARAGSVLAALAAASLVDRLSEDRYRLHDLIRRYAQDRVGVEETAAGRADAMRRLLGWYLRTARAAVAALGHTNLPLPDEPDPGEADPFDTATAAASWLDTERDLVVLAIEYAAEHGPAPYAWHLAEAIRPDLHQRYHLDACERAVRAALRAAGERPAVTAVLHLSRGTARFLAGRPEQALDSWATAVRDADVAAEPEVRAKALTNLGYAHLELGELTAAEARLAEASRVTDQPELRAGLSNALGVVSLERGRLREARQRFADAAAASLQTGNERMEKAARENLGEVDLELGDYRRGVDELRGALRLARLLGAAEAEAPPLIGLGKAFRLTGELTRANRDATRALTVARDTGQPRFEVDALNELGLIAGDQGFPELAQERFGQARSLATRLGYQRAVAESQAGSALACLAGGAQVDAQRHAAAGYALSSSRGLRLLEARLLVILSRIAEESGDRTGAAGHAHAAVARHTRTGSRSGLADALVALGTAEPAEAARHWRRALYLYEGIGSPLAAAVRDRLAGALGAAAG
ncbi:MAG: BTAD domain-containing putative transcriptional regulator [Actinocatenispora sp.]